MPGAHFQAPLVVDNKEGWGPTDDTFQYKDMPYQPYSKSDQLGKVGQRDVTFLLDAFLHAGRRLDRHRLRHGQTAEQ